jgi:hypothetical protein
MWKFLSPIPHSFCVYWRIDGKKIFKPIQRICRKNLFVHREDAKRPLAYSPHYMPRDRKVLISQLIIIRILNFFRFFLSTLYGMDEAKKPSYAIVPLSPYPNRSSAAFGCPRWAVEKKSNSREGEGGWGWGLTNNLLPWTCRTRTRLVNIISAYNVCKLSGLPI